MKSKGVKLGGEEPKIGLFAEDMLFFLKASKKKSYKIKEITKTLWSIQDTKMMSQDKFQQ